eukprot:TRINITY_DN73119_c0_g1_i1.p1 TRINITY_DN73119_c0_g1~~TRINITY_DN73119_c0_g1_i1.p1  ORF type:complete len:385 (+),score=60.19 TRINITY_DN73119_c0_g1_i1:51-1205(+)
MEVLAAATNSSAHGDTPLNLSKIDIAEFCIILLPASAVFWAVLSQSKTVAAFAQLSGVQERNDVRESIAKKAIRVDKGWFNMGVSNGYITAYMVGAWPCSYFLYYTPKVLILIILRFATFYKKKQHFLLWDFCYWANFLCIFYCWFMPTSPWLFRVVFMCANGPLAWSVLAFNHAMIFHSYAHVTSVVVHTSPLILSYGLRWYAIDNSQMMGSRFKICESGADSCYTDVHFWQLIWEALTGFYLWWMILYYIWIFVALGSYVERNGYQTLWDRILIMKPVGPVLQKLLKSFPKLLVQFVYLLIHLAFSVCTMCVACLLWYYQSAHFLFCFAIIFSTVKNAGIFYFDVFEKHYQDAAGQPGGDSVGKKILAASPALAEISQPLGC